VGEVQDVAERAAWGGTNYYVIIIIIIITVRNSYFRRVGRMARLGNWKSVVLVGKIKREHLLMERNFNIKRDFLGRLREEVDEVLKV